MKVIVQEAGHSHLCRLCFQEEACLCFACSKTGDYGQVCTPPKVNHFCKGSECCALALRLQVRVGSFFTTMYRT